MFLITKEKEMGTIVRLSERSSKHVCASNDATVVEDCETAFRAISDQLTALVSINESLERGIEALLKCLSELDRIVLLLENSRVRIKLRTKIKSLEASLILVSIELDQANRTASTAVRGTVGDAERRQL